MLVDARHEDGELIHQLCVLVMGFKAQDVPQWGFDPISCSTPSSASSQLVARLYESVKALKAPHSDKTPSYGARNATIRRRYADGERIANLARDFGISVQRVHQIIRGRRK